MDYGAWQCDGEWRRWKATLYLETTLNRNAGRSHEPHSWNWVRIPTVCQSFQCSLEPPHGQDRSQLNKQKQTKKCLIVRPVKTPTPLFTYNASYMNSEITISTFICLFQKERQPGKPNLLDFSSRAKHHSLACLTDSCIDCAHVFVSGVTLSAAINTQAFGNVCVRLIKGAPEWFEMDQGWFLSCIWRFDNSMHRNEKTHLGKKEAKNRHREKDLSE